MVDFLNDALMQAETNSILHQRMQIVWKYKSIYTLKLFPKHMKQFTKFPCTSGVRDRKCPDLDIGW